MTARADPAFDVPRPGVEQAAAGHLAVLAGHLRRLAPAGDLPAALTGLLAGLFSGSLGVPVGGDFPALVLDEAARAALAEAARLPWAEVSPTVFGWALQDARTLSERHAGGEHYTSAADIARLLEPLMLGDLSAAVAAAWGDPAGLAAVRERLGRLRVLDPACGCGNFLVVAYRALRDLETRVLRRLAALTGAPGDLGAAGFRVRIDAFRGIEIDALAARVARVALAVAQAQADRAAADLLDAPPPVIGAAHVRDGNALTVDWSSVCPIDEDTLIVGNPPFLGGRQMSRDQKADQLRIWGKIRGNGAVDFVGNWFLLAARAMTGTAARAAFVSTDSIAQGEQPSILWGALGPLGIGIDFAYRPFTWEADAGQQATVRVVIVGFSDHRTRGGHAGRPVLFTDPAGPGVPVAHLNGYLLDGPEVLIASRATPLPGGQRIAVGSQPTDGGHLAKISPAEAVRIRAEDPVAARYLRRFLGAEELVHGAERFCLWLAAATPAEITASPVLRERVAAVRAMRLASTMASTVRDADTPHLFQADRQPTERYLAVPAHSTDARPYLTTGFFDPDVIAGNALLTISGATLATFGLLSSRVFTAWNATVSGRLGAAYRVTPATTYNNFPWPEWTADTRSAVESAAAAVLAARAEHPDRPLGDLYDPPRMPAPLRAACAALDAAVLATYRLATAASDAAIVACLFTRHAALTAPAAADPDEDLALFAA